MDGRCQAPGARAIIGLNTVASVDVLKKEGSWNQGRLIEYTLQVS